MKQKALFQTAMRAFQLKPIPQEDGEGEDPLYLNPPRLAIAEQSSHACDTLGCPACSDFAVDLRCHRFKIHGEHLPSIGKSPKGSDGNHRAPSGQSMRLILPESAAVNSKTEEWPKLMYLSSGLLAAGQRYNNNGDDEFIYDSDGNTINGSDDD